MMRSDEHTFQLVGCKCHSTALPGDVKVPKHCEVPMGPDQPGHKLHNCGL